MSDLWNRCRSALREHLAPADCHRSIEPLRARFDGDILYLWVDREEDDWRPIPNPAKDFDREIRAVARQALGRPLRDVRYLDRPPNFEKLVTERRLREYRESESVAQEREREQLDAIVAEEYEQLKVEILRNPRMLGKCHERELGVKIQRMAMDRAKRRQERELWQARLRPFSRSEPPRDPPPWPPDPITTGGGKPRL